MFDVIVYCRCGRRHFFCFISIFFFLFSFIWYTVGLTKKCKVREEKNYDYKKLMKISDVPGIQVRCHNLIIFNFWLISFHFIVFLFFFSVFFCVFFLYSLNLAQRLSCAVPILRASTARCAYCFFTGGISQLVTRQSL